MNQRQYQRPCQRQCQKQWKMSSPIGPLYLVASESALRGVLWRKASVPMAESLAGSAPELRILARAVRQIEEYLAGKRRDFDLPLELDGTEFQKRVWAQLARIPYGETWSYAKLATRIRNEKAVRAVGTANGRNPISLIIPCHRVIASDGTLGGYAGGLSIKSRLLELEQNA